MAVIVDRVRRRTIHPFHAFLLAGAAPLFLGALLSDIAYARSYQIQWISFASWLIAGALVVAGFWAWMSPQRVRGCGRSDAAQVPSCSLP